MQINCRVLICLAVVLVSSSVFAQDSEGTPYRKRTPRYTDQGAEVCLQCHSGPKMHAIAAGAHGEQGSPDSPLANRGCEACHGPGSFHVSRAHGGKGFPPMITFGRGSEVSPREEQIDTCLACHQEEVGNVGMIEFRDSPHDRRTINCATCHVSHVESDPIHDREHQFSTCNRCHRKHIAEHPRFEDKSIDFDALACGTCHDVHKVIAGAPE
jgi:DmsE family decaheme c-type cytochrome